MNGDVTLLLASWAAGDRAALDALVPIVYAELRQIADRQLRGERAAHTLQPTALVNEAFLRLAGGVSVNWKSRAHFFAVSSGIMRRVLVDHARRKAAEKRGGLVATISLDAAAIDWPERKDLDVLALDDALDLLATLDVQQGKVVEMRFFGGLSVEETAEALDVSPTTVKREWRMARAWLLRELSRG